MNMTADEIDAFLSSISLAARSLKRLADAAEKSNELKDNEIREKRIGGMREVEKTIKEKTRGSSLK